TAGCSGVVPGSMWYTGTCPRVVVVPRGFDRGRDGEELMREIKPGYGDRSPRPRVSPLSGRLAEFAKRR
ncbi:MAG TPA: hypothetical protein VFI12_11060, partial [Thermomicrobiales bacterium]|nr:hypothetical protein [Thermomicrobiales bacterium]